MSGKQANQDIEEGQTLNQPEQALVNANYALQLANNFANVIIF